MGWSRAWTKTDKADRRAGAGLGRRRVRQAGGLEQDWTETELVFPSAVLVLTFDLSSKHCQVCVMPPFGYFLILGIF